MGAISPRHLSHDDEVGEDSWMNGGFVNALNCHDKELVSKTLKAQFERITQNI